MTSSIKKNLGLQTIYQILNTCIPFITAPYLARKLGAVQLGVFSYTSSIVAYFTLIAMLGTVNYGTRSIASVRNDKKECSSVFWSIFALQVIVTIGMLVAYIGYLFFVCKDNQLIATLQIISIVACLFDINWFFFGIEGFRITVTRSIIIRVITVALILLLVNSEQDLWIYTVIMLGGTLLSQVVLFFYLPRYVIWTGVGIERIKKHIKPNLVLFIPLLAMSVYHTMDKTMLGMLSTYEQSGFYYNSDKVINIPMAIINGIGTVMLPRMAALLGERRRKEADELFVTTLEGVAAVSIAIACGIAAVANEFIPIFYGKGYDACILLTMVFTPIFIVKSLSVIIRTQYLIPMNLEKEFTKSVVGGAVVNFVFNILLIPKYGALGAVIATFLAELAACVLQFYSLKGRSLALKQIIKRSSFYLVVGLLMIIVVRFVSIVPGSLFIKLIIEIVAGGVFYSVITVLFWIKTGNHFYQILIEPVVKGVFNK